jgi:acetylornithine aminotransferase
LGRVCGYDDYSLFLCNSGAEANENALKVASFHTGKAKVLAFRKAFHGRTSGAVAATDNPKIQAPFNATDNIIFAPLNDLEAVDNELSRGGFAAVIIEGIQGVAGIYEPTVEFINGLRLLCDKYGCLLILDEIQSGYGRTGKFFAHQHYGVRADIITMAKGMGNGFPIGGVLIAPHIKPWHGQLGTTFGGNHLACAAALAVLEVIENEQLVDNAAKVGEYLLSRLQGIKGATEVRGRGLMIGVEFDAPIKEMRTRLVKEQHTFTGAASTNILRLLPPLTLTMSEADEFLERLNRVLS